MSILSGITSEHQDRELKCLVFNCTNTPKQGPGMYFKLLHFTDTVETKNSKQSFICMPCFTTITTKGDSYSKLHQNVLDFVKTLRD